ncbi:methyltransferase type 11 [Lentzea guizhouensis]|uniref:Methyltransferase type 11 n=1 Tax=Lentzea guizhouensis TaxID=1586287 RepID=A0A1B2HLD8_9PSEU|nr:class I SAM-dependent methyltransferase [Lentzea guizhouensis]ANZ38542.1 methyltransferase type 11 [Lentzea guizhouensis]
MKEVVESGYDAIARTYLEWSAEIRDDPRAHYLGVLDQELANNADVLELGCGAGVPSTRRLAERHNVTGVDLSRKQVELAGENVPNARFVKADMSVVGFEEHSFDAVVALYSILHLPRAEQPGLFGRIARWLRPGGVFLASLGTGTPDTTERWLGVDMFFGSNTPERNRELLEEHFTVEVDDLVTMHEPGPATFQWVLSRR